MKSLRGLAAALLLAPALLVAGCDDQQSAEKTGAEVGRAVGQTAERIGEAAKNATEKAGETLQNAGDAIEKKAEDAKQ